MAKESHCRSLCHTAPSNPLREFLPVQFCRKLGSLTSHHVSDVTCEEDVTTHNRQTQVEVTRDFEGISITCW